VVVVVVLTGVVAVTVQPEPAAADYASPPNAWYSPEAQARINAWISAGAPPQELVPPLNSSPSADKAWFEGKTKAGRLPRLRALGSVALKVTNAAAFTYIGWEIGHATGLSDWAYGHFSGIGAIPVGSGPSGGFYGFTDELPSPSCSTQSPPDCVGAPGWRLTFTGLTGSTEFCDPGVASTPACNTVRSPDGYAALLAIDAQPGPQQLIAVNPARCGISSGGACYSVVILEDAMEPTFTPLEQRVYNSATDASRKTHTTPNQPIAGPWEPATLGDGSTGDLAMGAVAADPTLAAAIDTALFPGTGGGTETATVTLPAPYSTETAPDYRERLRNLGFLGTVVFLDADEGSPEEELRPVLALGPEIVTAVRVATPTITTTFPVTSPWPDPAPRLEVPGETTTVTVVRNPVGAPVPAPGTPPPPGSAPPGGGGIGPGDCSCPPPDFTPITGIDYGDKFPFGVLALAAGFLGTTIFASPDAPVFDFDFSGFQAGGFGPYDLGHYTVDLNVLDAYVAIVRTLMAYAIWIGGLWWFGTRWFGFKGGGDVGAAVDEAY
jgi:hypothetical protein